MSPRFSTVLFDADDTLLDFGKAEASALVKTFADYAITLTPNLETRYKEVNKKLWNDFEDGIISKEDILNQRFTIPFVEFDISVNGREFNDAYMKNLCFSYDMMDGAEEICRALAPHCTLYFATNGVANTQHRRIEGSGLKKYFAATFVSEEAGAPKPESQFFDYCFANIPNLDKSKTIIIGDSLFSDIKGGSDAGIFTCWYNPEGKPCKPAFHPDYTISDLSELKNIILG